MVFGALKKSNKRFSSILGANSTAVECLTVKGDVAGWMAAGWVRSMSDNGRKEGSMQISIQ